MSELQNQVQSLRRGLVLSGSLLQVPSLFLSPSDAAKVDVSAVHEAALRSLRTLGQYDDRLLAFEATNSLLHPASMSLQRELKTKEVIVYLEYNPAINT